MSSPPARRGPPPPPPALPPPPPPAVGASSSAEDAPARKRKRDRYYDRPDELAELAAKDELTLMVRQLHPRTEEFEIFTLFSTAGRVNDVRLIVDEKSGKCLGVGYVEMDSAEGVAKALTLDGSSVHGMPVVVQSSLAEKNRLAAAGASAAQIKAAGLASAAAFGAAMDQGMKLYVGNLHPNLSEDQLRGVFGPFGQLDRVDVHRATGGESKGYAFLHYALAADGQRCMAQMDGFNLAGRPIRVSLSGQDASAGSQGAAGLGVGGGRGSHDSSIEKLDSLDEGSGGSKVTAAQRAQMMARLAEKSGVMMPGEVRQASRVAATIGQETSTSRCVVLKNMFDRLSDEAQSNPNFFREIAEDVRSEVSKMGTVIHCAADKWSNGFVYCKLLTHQVRASALAPDIDCPSAARVPRERREPSACHPP